MDEVRVVVLAESDATSERVLVRGFHEVALLRGWTVLRYVARGADLEALIRNWNPAAVVVSWTVALPYPACIRDRVLVAMHADHGQRDIASIALNDERIGEIAAEHLLATGLKHFATFWYGDLPFARRRSDSFGRAILRAGGTFHREGEFGSPHGFARQASHEVVAAWLKTLPRPCGVFACCDQWAGLLVYYCGTVGARIPEDIALVGVDNDELECEVSSPPITSVAIPWFEAGREVANLVELGLKGAAPPTNPVLIEPIGVVARRSSDLLAIDDAEVAAAVRWIRDNAHRPITVPDIVNAVLVYRQRLERRFRVVLGRTIMEEVRMTRVELARRLLRGSSLSIPEVAQRSGFGSATMLGITFRKETSLTPMEYRRRFSRGGEHEGHAD